MGYSFRLKSCFMYIVSNDPYNKPRVRFSWNYHNFHFLIGRYTYLGVNSLSKCAKIQIFWCYHTNIILKWEERQKCLDTENLGRRILSFTSKEGKFQG